MLFFLAFFPLALYHCSSRRGFSRANTPLGFTAPTPVTLGHWLALGPSATACLCLDGQRGRSRLWQRRTERDEAGCSTRGGCMHRWESAVWRAATCNPRKPGWGFVLQSGSSWCRWGSFPPCCQPGEVLGSRRCRVPGARGRSIFTCAIRWTSVCSPAETSLQCRGSWAPGNCGLNATERGGEGREMAPVGWERCKVPAQG